jgi:hypothetical protein
MSGPSKKWKDTMNEAIRDTAWDAYDDIIKKEVTFYNSKFSAKPALPNVNWLILKAMLWNESGGPTNPQWKKRTMQIGNKGDPALKVLTGGKEGSHLIAAPELISKLRAGKVNDPEINIRAGLAYLYTRMATFDHASIRDPKDTKVHEYKVVGGDSLSKIAKKVGTTVAELKAMNPKAEKMIRPGDILEFHKASIEMVVTGWRTFDTKTIAKRYNGGGDPNYEAKLNHLLSDVIPKLDAKRR